MITLRIFLLLTLFACLTLEPATILKGSKTRPEAPRLKVDQRELLTILSRSVYATTALVDIDSGTVDCGSLSPGHVQIHRRYGSMPQIKETSQPNYPDLLKVYHALGLALELGCHAHSICLAIIHKANELLFRSKKFPMSIPETIKLTGLTEKQIQNARPILLQLKVDGKYLITYKPGRRNKAGLYAFNWQLLCQYSGNDPVEGAETSSGGIGDLEKNPKKVDEKLLIGGKREDRSQAGVQSSDSALVCQLSATGLVEGAKTSAIITNQLTNIEDPGKSARARASKELAVPESDSEDEQFVRQLIADLWPTRGYREEDAELISYFATFEREKVLEAFAAAKKKGTVRRLRWIANRLENPDLYDKSLQRKWLR